METKRLEAQISLHSARAAWSASPDSELLALAQAMFESGAPRELWAAVLCEAHGLEHNLPKTRGQLGIAQLRDIALTTEALNR